MEKFFFKYFDSVGICKLDDNLKYKRIIGSFSSSQSDRLITYCLTVTEESIFDIKLYHYREDKNRKETIQFDIGFFILRFNENGKLSRICNTSFYFERSVIEPNITLQKGYYLIVPVSIGCLRSKENNPLKRTISYFKNFPRK